MIHARAPFSERFRVKGLRLRISSPDIAFGIIGLRL